jgi:hypothetical protein
MTNFTGISFQATKINNNKIVGCASLAQLETAGFGDPATVSSAKVRERAADPSLREEYNLRESIQRQFDAPRKKRAEVYSHFIERSSKGEIMGDTPPINIFVPCPVEYSDGAMTIPFGQVLVAIDGETQAHARFLWAGRDPSSKITHLFPVVFHVDISIEDAQQRLHDYNHYCTPVNETLLASTNHNSDLVQGVRKAMQDAGIPPAAVDRFHNTPPKTGGYEITLKQAQFGCVGAEFGLLKKPAQTMVIDLNHATSGSLHINGSSVGFLASYMGLPMELRRKLTPDCVYILGVIFKNYGEAAMAMAAENVDAAFKKAKGPQFSGWKKYEPIMTSLVSGGLLPNLGA